MLLSPAPCEDPFSVWFGNKPARGVCTAKEKGKGEKNDRSSSSQVDSNELSRMRQHKSVDDIEEKEAMVTPGDSDATEETVRRVEEKEATNYPDTDATEEETADSIRSTSECSEDITPRDTRTHEQKIALAMQQTMLSRGNRDRSSNVLSKLQRKEKVLQEFPRKSLPADPIDWNETHVAVAISDISRSPIWEKYALLCQEYHWDGATLTYATLEDCIEIGIQKAHARVILGIFQRERQNKKASGKDRSDNKAQNEMHILRTALSILEAKMDKFTKNQRTFQRNYMNNSRLSRLQWAISNAHLSRFDYFDGKPAFTEAPIREEPKTTKSNRYNAAAIGVDRYWSDYVYHTNAKYPGMALSKQMRSHLTSTKLIQRILMEFYCGATKSVIPAGSVTNFTLKLKYRSQEASDMITQWEKNDNYGGDRYLHGHPQDEWEWCLDENAFYQAVASQIHNLLGEPPELEFEIGEKGYCYIFPPEDLRNLKL